MKINILRFIEGAQKAKGIAVIIDVFRAFSTACYVMAAGAEKIIAVGDIQIAYELKKAYPDNLLMGERNSQIPPGFDHGNSPSEIQSADLRGITVIHTTSAGTQGIVNAFNSEEVITGSFVNARAVAKYIKKRQPKEVSLVCMGFEGKTEAAEDEYCAKYIQSILHEEEFDFQEIIEKLRTGSGKRFFVEENQGFSPRKDFELCLGRDRFDFVLRAAKESEGICLRKIYL
ncbi:MAG: 2-phosphosulfolactate phosphatase [Dehalobacter sp. 4CP]|nr:2-phosphosulfolactate phosphatase [Dehalobacter sp. 4CP]